MTKTQQQVTTLAIIFIFVTAILCWQVVPTALAESETDVDMFWAKNQLTAEEIALYNTIEAKMQAVQTGDTFTGGRKGYYLETISNIPLTWQAVLDAVLADHPEFYWCDYLLTLNKYSGDNKLIIYVNALKDSGGNFKYIDSTGNADEYRLKDADRNTLSKTSATGIVAHYTNLIAQQGATTAWQKVKLVHDELLSTVRYASNGELTLNGSTYADYHSVYGAFCSDGVVVCEGYAKAFQYILKSIGIPCITVTGSGLGKTTYTNSIASKTGEGHMWNMVKLDGEWYNFDPTWDDVTFNYINANTNEVEQRNHVLYTYFAVPNHYVFYSSHIADDSYDYPTPASTEHSENDILPTAGTLVQNDNQDYVQTIGDTDVQITAGTFTTCTDRRTVAYTPHASESTTLIPAESAYYMVDNTPLVEMMVSELVAGEHMGQYTAANLSICHYLRRIGDRFFVNQSNLTSVQFAPTTAQVIITHIDGSVDPDPLIVDVGGVTEIGESAFNNCYNLTKLSIPDTVETVGDYAFSNTSRLDFASDNAHLSNALVTLGSRVFEYNGTTILTIPASLRNVADDTFVGMYVLAGFVVEDGNMLFAARQGVLLNKAGNRILLYPKAKKGAYTDANITSVANRAFAGISGLRTINLPNAWDIGEGAFYDCTNLESIVLASTLKEIKAYTFYNTALASYRVYGSVESIADHAFGGNDALKTVLFEGNAPTFGANSFDCDNVKLMLPIAYEASYLADYDYAALTFRGLPAYYVYTASTYATSIYSDDLDTADETGSMGFDDENKIWTAQSEALTISNGMNAPMGVSFDISLSIRLYSNAGLQVLTDGMGNAYRIVLDATSYDQNNTIDVVLQRVTKDGVDTIGTWPTMSLAMPNVQLRATYQDGTLRGYVNGYLYATAIVDAGETTFGLYAQDAGATFANWCARLYGDQALTFDQEVNVENNQLLFDQEMATIVSNHDYDGTSKFEMSATLTGAGGLVFAHDSTIDGETYYRAYLDAEGHLHLTYVSGESAQEVTDYVVTQQNPATSYQLALLRQENHILLSLNGMEVLNYIEPVRKGGTGYGLWTSEGMTATSLVVIFKNDYSKLDENDTNLQGIRFTLLEGYAMVGVGDEVDNAGYAGIGYGKVVIPAAVRKNGTSYPVKYVAANAFATNTYLKVITLPDGIIGVNDAAFANASNMTKLIAKGDAFSLGTNVFANCNALFHIEAKQGSAGWGITYDYPLYYNVATIYSDDPVYAAYILLDENKRTSQGVQFTLSGNFAKASKMLGTTKDVTIYRRVLANGRGYTVNGITDQAFANTTLETITLPSSITSIGVQAFSGSNLKRFEVPQPIGTIKDRTFENCYQLTTVTYAGDLVTDIKQYAFAGCSRLQMELPHWLTDIGNYAFAGCTLMNPTLPGSLNTIGAYAFAQTGIAVLDLRYWGTTINAGAFANCLQLTTVNIDKTFEKISSNAFAGCTALSTVNFAEGSALYEIGVQAFADCTALQNITLPKKLSRLNEEAFVRCDNLTAVYFAGDKPTFGANVFGAVNGDVVLYYDIDRAGWQYPKIDEGYYATYTNDTYDVLNGAILETFKLHAYGTRWIPSNGGVYRLARRRGDADIIAVASIANVEVAQQDTIDFVASVTGLEIMNDLGTRYGLMARANIEDTAIYNEVSTTALYYYIDTAYGTANLGLVQGGAVQPLASESIIDYAAQKTYQMRIVSFADGSVVCYLNNVRLLEYTLDADTISALGGQCSMRCDLIPNNTDGNLTFANASLRISGANQLTMSAIGEDSLVLDQDKGAKMSTAPYMGFVVNYLYDTTSMFDYKVEIVYAESVVAAGLVFGSPAANNAAHYRLLLERDGYTVYLALYYCSGEQVTRIIREAIAIVDDYDLTSQHGISVRWNAIDTIDAYYNNSWLFQVKLKDTLQQYAISGGAYFGLYAQDAGAGFVNQIYTVSGNIGTSEVTEYSILAEDNSNIQGVLFVLDEDSLTAVVGTGDGDGNALYDGSNDGLVVIPDVVQKGETKYRVVGIAQRAFYGNSAIIGVDISANVQQIGAYAFGQCSQLLAINLPMGIQEIAEGLFEECTGLTDINIPEAVTTIDEKAFYGCSNLTDIYIPASVAQIAPSAFAYCNAIKIFAVDRNNTAYAVEAGVLYNRDKSTLVRYPSARAGSAFALPNSVTQVADYAFEGCNLSSIDAGNATAIGRYALANCTNLKTLTLSDKLTVLAQGLLQNTPVLTSLYLPNALETIESKALCHTGLQAIEVPQSVTNIESYAFAYNEALAQISFLGNPASVGDYAMAYCPALQTFALPSSVSVWGDKLFAGSYGATSAYIGHNATLQAWLDDDDAIVLAKCTHLSQITVEDNAYFALDEQGVLYSHDYYTLYALPMGIDMYRVKQDTQIIAPYALSSLDLTTVYLPQSVATLGDMAIPFATVLWDANTVEDEFVYPDIYTTLYNRSVDPAMYPDLFDDLTARQKVVLWQDLRWDYIELIGNKGRLEYTIGSEVEYNGKVVNVYIDADSNEYRLYALSYALDYINYQEGLATVIVTAEQNNDMQAQYEVYFNADKTVIGLVIEHLPKKTEYLVGDELDYKGLLAYVLYDNNEHQYITLDDVVLEGYDKTQDGTQTITLTYTTAFGTQWTAQFDIAVYNKQIISFRFVQPYCALEDVDYGTQLLNLDGMTLVAIFNTGDTRTLAYGEDYTLSAFDPYKVNSMQLIEVLFADGINTDQVAQGDMPKFYIRVKKLTPPTPLAPTLKARNSDTIMVVATEPDEQFAYQFAIFKDGDWSAWQDSGTFGGLRANREYAFRVRIKASSGNYESEYSEEAHYKTAPKPQPDIPSIDNFTIIKENEVDNGDAKISITIIPATSIDTTHIQYTCGSGWQTSPTFEGLEGNTTYYFYVRYGSYDEYEVGNRSTHYIAYTTGKYTPSVQQATWISRTTDTVQVYEMGENYRFALFDKVVDEVTSDINYVQATDWQASNTFAGLEQNTYYYIDSMMVETATTKESRCLYYETVRTRREAPAAPTTEQISDIYFEMSETQEVLEYRAATYDAEMDSWVYGDWQTTRVFATTPNTTYRVQCRYKETELSSGSSASDYCTIQTERSAYGTVPAPILQPVDDEHTEEPRTKNRIILQGYKNVAYRISTQIDGVWMILQYENGAWQAVAPDDAHTDEYWTTQYDFAHLLPNTTYRFRQMYVGDDVFAPSAPSAALVVTTKHDLALELAQLEPQLEGTGAYMSNLSLTLPQEMLPYIEFTWLRDGEVLKDTDGEEVHTATYTVSWLDLAYDGVKQLSVHLKALGEYEGEYTTQAVTAKKAKQTAIPSITADSIQIYTEYISFNSIGQSYYLSAIIDEIEITKYIYSYCEYQCQEIEDSPWVSNMSFSKYNLEDGIEYHFRCRYKENELYETGEPSEYVSKTIYRTTMLNGTITIEGEKLFGESISLNFSGFNLDLDECYINIYMVERYTKHIEYTCDSGYKFSTTNLYEPIVKTYDRTNTLTITELQNYYKPYEKVNTSKDLQTDYSKNGTSLNKMVEYDTTYTYDYQGYYIVVYVGPKDSVEGYYGYISQLFGPIDKRSQARPSTLEIEDVTATTVTVKPSPVYYYSLDNSFATTTTPRFAVEDGMLVVNQDGVAFVESDSYTSYLKNTEIRVNGQNSWVRYYDGQLQYTTDAEVSASTVWLNTASFDFVLDSEHNVTQSSMPFEYRIYDGEKWSDWQSEPYFDGLINSTEYIVTTRNKGDGQHYASSTATETHFTTGKMDVRQPTVEDYEKMTVTHNSITFAKKDLTIEKGDFSIFDNIPADAVALLVPERLDMEFRLEYEGHTTQWSKNAVLDKIFDGTDVLADTIYTVYIRFAETTCTNASQEVVILIHTRKTPNPYTPQAIELSTTVDPALTDTTIVLEAIEGLEYAMVIEGVPVDKYNWQASPIFDGLEPNTSYDLISRYAENDIYAASNPSEMLTVTTLHANHDILPTVTDIAPYIRSYNANSILLKDSIVQDNVTLGIFEFALDQDLDGEPDGGMWHTEFRGLLPNTTYHFVVRYAEDEVYFASNVYAMLNGSVTTPKKEQRTVAPAPTVLIMTVTSLTLLDISSSTVTYEYCLVTGNNAPIDSSARWQDSYYFDGLTNGEFYTAYARIKENDTTYAGPASTGLSIQLQSMELHGKVGINSDTTDDEGQVAYCYGATLTPDLNNLQPLSNDLSFKWEVQNGEDWEEIVESGQNAQNAYVVKSSDIGKYFRLTVEGGPTTPGTLHSEAVYITKGYIREQPPKPTATVEGTTITISVNDAYEYAVCLWNEQPRLTDWNKESVHAGLHPDTEYAIYCRKPESAYYYAGATSEPIKRVTTLNQAESLPQLKLSDITLSNVGGILEIKTEDGCEYAVTGKGLDGQWYADDGTTHVLRYVGLHSGEKYTVMAKRSADDTHYASAIVNYVVTMPKQAQAAPNTAPTMLSRTESTITLDKGDGRYEYSMDGTTWQASNVFGGLLPNTDYTFYQRYKANSEYDASEASDGAQYRTDKTTPAAIAYRCSATDTRITVRLTEEDVPMGDRVEYAIYDGRFDAILDIDKFEQFTWQESNIFEGLEPNYHYYTVFARIQETEDHKVGNVDFTNLVYVKTAVQYFYRIYDENDTLIDTVTVYEGQSVRLGTPTKQADNVYRYQFVQYTDWIDDYAHARSDVDVHAQFKSIYIEYVLTFKNFDGTGDYAVRKGHYGEDVLSVDAPSLDDVDGKEYRYFFDAWQDEQGNQIDELPAQFETNMVYTMIWHREIITYTVKFFNNNGTEIEEWRQTGIWNDPIVFPEDEPEYMLDPEDYETDPENMVFDFWDGPADREVMNEDKVFVAVFVDNRIKCSHNPSNPYNAEIITVFDKVEATCTTDGNELYYYCTHHKVYFRVNELGINYLFTLDPADFVIAALGHDIKHYDAQDPTCTEAGWDAYDACSRCDYSTKVDIPALGHDYHSEVLAPTCDEAGYTLHTCSRCTDSYTTDIVSALGHDWGEWTIVTDATCTTIGLRTRVCKRDADHEDSEEIAALGHEYIAVVTAPTCTEQGYTTYTCSRCQDSYKDNYVAKLGHDIKHHEAKEPTCTEVGWYAYDDCTRCNYTTYEQLDALGHNYQDVVTAPTCTEAGYTTHTCSRCQDSNVDTYVDALGHNWGEWTMVTAPTCTEKGREQHICTRDNNHIETRDIDAMGHSMVSHLAVEATCTLQGKEAYWECTQCNMYFADEEGEMVIDNLAEYGIIDSLGHDYHGVVTAPTCTEQGYTTYSCSRCEASYKADYVDALGHDYVDVVTAPTCTEQGYTTHTCSRCQDSNIDTYVGALGHDWGEWAEVTAPTCTEMGSKQRVCKHDNSHVDVADTEALGHNYVAVVTAPTCTEQGYTTYTCSRCQDNYKDNYTETLGHDWDTDYTVDIPATCSEDGKESIHCKRCDATKDAHAIPSLGSDHDWKYSQTIAPTCEEKGYDVYTCSICHTTKQENEVPSLGHEWGEWAVGTPATCTEMGSKQRVCKHDNSHVDVADIEALGHNYVAVVTAPTCTEKGYTTHTCSRCQDSYVDTYNDALGHKATLVEAVAATCQEAGKQAYYQCDTCKAYFEDEDCTKQIDNIDEYGIVAALGHIYQDAVTAPTCTEQGYTTHTCSRCQDSYVDTYVDALGHAWGDWTVVTPATCTEKGYTTHTCSRCQDSYVDTYVDALGHTATLVEAVAATCQEAGKLAYYQCDTCKAYFEDEDCTKQIDNIDEYGIVAALGHAYQDTVTAPTCTEQGYTTHTCSRCQDSYVDTYVDALGHTWGEWTVVTPATCTEKGSKQRICEHDNTHIDVADIDALGHTATLVEAEAATCLDAGKLAYYQCDTCKAYFEDENCTKQIDNIDEYGIVAALGHAYQDTVTAPTCTEQGYTTHTCSRCQDSYVDSYVDALGHKATLVEAVAATCLEAGKLAYYQCDTCKAYFEDEDCTKQIDNIDEYGIVAALGHAYQDEVTAPTCTEQGYTTHTCSRCQDSYVDTYVDALGHKATLVEAVAATCLEAGKLAYYQCDTCKAYFEDEDCTKQIDNIDEYGIVAALGHAYQDTVTAPTCTEQGYTTHICSRCQDSYVDTYVDVLNHAWGDWTVVTPATCTEKGIKQRICEHDNTHIDVADIDALGHTATMVEAVAATCLEAGKQAYYQCDTCKAYFEDEDCTKQIDNIDEYGIVAALGHAYQDTVTAPTCTEQGYTTHTCSRCQDSYVDTYVDALGHTWGEWIVEQEPTQTQDGLRKHQCTACKETEQETIVASPALKSFLAAVDNINRDATRLELFEQIRTAVAAYNAMDEEEQSYAKVAYSTLVDGVEAYNLQSSEINANLSTATNVAMGLASVFSIAFAAIATILKRLL